MRNAQPANGDPILRLQRRIDELERQIVRLKSISRLSIPIYTPAILSELDLNDGEVWINLSDNSMNFQCNSVARKITSNP